MLEGVIHCRQVELLRLKPSASPANDSGARLREYEVDERHSGSVRRDSGNLPASNESIRQSVGISQPGSPISKRQLIIVI